MWFNRHHTLPKKNVFGLDFNGPFDFAPVSVEIDRFSLSNPALPRYREVELCDDVEHLFTIIYDFTQLIVISADSFERVDAPDLFDTLDSILSTRLIYDHYVPVLVRISEGEDLDGMERMVNYARLSGIDGLIVPGIELLLKATEMTGGGLPLVAYSHLETPEDALERIRFGAELVDCSGKNSTWRAQADKLWEQTL